MAVARDLLSGSALLQTDHAAVLSKPGLACAPRHASSGMTHRGRSPLATRWILSKPFRNRAVQFSQVGPAECGVSVTLGSEKMGWFAGGGSAMSTSSPAPAI